ncbi:MAG: GNAT family N-acetyltransferase [Rhizobacter sp.]|nr:GNAT family N-acetyltransferase [Rhizobacter sp.]
MQTLVTERLMLEPLQQRHASEMFALLNDPALYQHLDYGPPATLEHLVDVYRQLEARRSPDGSEGWLNWIVRADGRALGYVQATVLGAGLAWVGYVMGRNAWGRGFAREAVGAMLSHLQEAHGVRHILASVEVANDRSIRLLERLQFHTADAAEASGHELSASERLYVLSAPAPAALRQAPPRGSRKPGSGPSFP